jgi:tetratricopeptide (TPR) repeat protein
MKLPIVFTRWIFCWRRCLSIAAVLLVGTAVFWGPAVIAQYQLHRGAAELRRFHTAEGQRWLLEAEKYAPQNGEVHFLLARTLRHEWKFDAAERELQRALDCGVPGTRVRIERTLAKAQTAHVRDVQRDLPRLLESPGDDGEEICAAFVNGFCINLNFAAADQLLTAWISDYPQSAEAHFRRGNFFYGQMDWMSAVAAYSECVKFDPTRWKARLSLAQCALNLHDPGTAEPEFRRVLRENPQLPAAELGLGDCLFTLARVDEARAIYEQIAARHPRDFAIREKLGALELQVGNPQRALDWLSPVAKAWPEDLAIALQMAQALQQTQDSDAARPYLETARRGEQAISRLDELLEEVRERPHDLEIRCELGTTNLRLRSREDGVNWLKSVLQYDPRHIEAHLALAEYFKKMGDAEQAEQHERAAADANSN